MTKYLVIGGRVGSRKDDDVHYVSALRLCELYGLDPSDPDVRLTDESNPALPFLRGYVKLRPRYDGNYMKIKKPNIDRTIDF